MKGKRRRWRAMSTGTAVLLSAFLTLLIGLLGNIVTNLVRVPMEWEWVPVLALILVFLISLPVSFRLAKDAKRTSTNTVTIERVELDDSEVSHISAEGQIAVKDVKAKSSTITDIKAG